MLGARRRTSVGALSALVLALLVGALLVAGAPRAQALTPGWFDTGYGTAGLGLAVGSHDGFEGSGTVDSSGRVVVLSVATPTASAIHISRLTVNGDLDSTFGTGGSTTLPNGPTYDFAQISAVGNAIFVAARVASGNGVAVVRLSADGVLDTAYGTGGVATVPIPNTIDAVLGVARLDGGDLLVAAAHQSTLPKMTYVAAVNATGGLDAGWNAAGTPGLVATSDAIADVAADAGGALLLVRDSAGVARVQRRTAAGAVDAAYGVSGTRTLTASLAAQRISVGSDGNAYVSGSYGTGASSPMAVARLLPAGTVDSGFGTAGIARVTLSDCQPTAMSVAVTASYVYVFGQHNSCGPQPILARLSTSGVLDPTFGSGGFIMLRYDLFGDKTPNELFEGAVQSSGQPVVAMSFWKGDNMRMGAIRLHVDSVAPNGAYVPLLPRRILDTRNGTGAAAHAVAAAGTLTVQVGGQGGVPATGVGAVVFNLTAVAPTRSGFVTAYPTGLSRPAASTLNHGAGANTPNLVTVPLGSAGQVSLYNGSSGTVQLLADVVGYYRSGPASAPGAFTPLAPARIVDTRTGTGVPRARLGAGQTVTFPVAGQQGVPASGVSSAVINLTAVTPSGSGYLTAYPAGGSRPAASSLNHASGQTRANLVTARLSAGGALSVYNGSAGSVDLVADVAGYYLGGTPVDPGTFVALTPTRVMDTRTALGTQAGPVRGGDDRSALSTPAPRDAAALVLNATVTQSTGGGYLAVQGDHEWYDKRYPVSALNFTAHQTVANMVIVGGSSFRIHNGSAGSVQEIADLAGYFLP